MTASIPPATCPAPAPPVPRITFEFKQFYLNCLAQASYLIGSKGQAAIVDPRRDVGVYIDEARARGLEIRYVIETHLHADFVSGHKELSERTGAQVLISKRAGATFSHHGVGDGETVALGDLTLTFLETPGHTPESLSVLVTDTNASDKPQMVLTGDTLFIGDVGRPDLLGSQGLTAEYMAGLLYDSLHAKLLPLQDDVLVYPAHGAGSLCGKNLSKDTFSTMGRQRASNVALQPRTRDEFIRFLTAESVETPRYFPMDVELNRRGAATLDDGAPPPALDAETFSRMQQEGGQVVDVRPVADYAAGYVPHSLNIGLEGQFASWAGTLLDPKRAILLVASDEQSAIDARMRLARVGLERVEGWLGGGLPAWVEAGLPVDTVPQVTVGDLHRRMLHQDPTARGPFQIIDVRRSAEWAAGHIEGALHAPLHGIADHASYLDPLVPTYVICGGGYRSVIAAEMLKELGLRGVVDVKGGMSEWRAQSLPVIVP